MLTGGWYKTFQIIWARHHIKHLQDRWCPCWLLKMCCWPQITHQTCLVSWSNFNRPYFNFSSKPSTLLSVLTILDLQPWWLFPSSPASGPQTRPVWSEAISEAVFLVCAKAMVTNANFLTSSEKCTSLYFTVHRRYQLVLYTTKNDWGKKHGKAELVLIEVLEKHPKPTITRWKIFAEKASLCW